MRLLGPGRFWVGRDHLRSSILAVFSAFVATAAPASFGALSTPSKSPADLPDGLSALETSPSPAATAQLSRLLTTSENPDARLWLVNALYERVRSRQDVDALSLLERTAKDSDLNVRRRAINSLAAFEFLPVREIEQIWLPRMKAAAKQAKADHAAEVRVAGHQLELEIETWQRTNASRGPNSVSGRGARDEQDAGFWSRISLAQALGILVWAAGFYLIAFIWQELNVRLLKASQSVGEVVLAEWRKCREEPALLLFPTLACLLELVVLGGGVAYGLLSWAVPSDDPYTWLDVLSAAGYLALILAVSVAGAFALIFCLAAYASQPSPRKYRTVFLRQHSVLLLAAFMGIGVWPWELLLKLFRHKISGESLWQWSAKMGAPLAGSLAAVHMVRDGVGVRAALQGAREKFQNRSDPAAAFFGLTAFQPQFVFPAVGAPIFCGAAILPALIIGFSPAQLFGWWFVSDAMCAIGFALWAGIMMAAGYLTILGALGALYAAGLATNPPPAPVVPKRRRTVRKVHG